MATYRIGIGSFNLKDGAVGIGTESTGLGNLKVEGTYKTTDLDVTGVSTFTRYAGFTPDNLEIGKDGRDRTLTGEHQTTGDIVVGVNSIFTVSVGATVDVGTVPSVSIGTHFSPPTGGVEDRPEVPVEGTVRFNRDLNTLEFYNGVDWRQFTVNGASGRAIIAGGHSSPGADISTMTSVQIMTTGNAVEFGNLVVAREEVAGLSNSIRGIFACGYTNSPAARKNDMDYFTIASGGQAVDFGDNTQSRNSPGSASSSTRGLVVGGYAPSPQAPNVIDYVEIMTIGNAIDFGDLPTDRYGMIGCASPTRAVFAGGGPHSPGAAATRNKKEIYEVTIASKGNAIEFGTLTQGRVSGGGSGNTVRGLFSGGYAPGPGANGQNTIDYITIASGGNAIDFGDRTVLGGYVTSTSTSIRSITVGERTPGGTSTNCIDYVTIMTKGNATDFGDAHSDWAMGTLGDSHGGLGGY